MLFAEQLSNEHIIPLALGGTDAFVLPVCRRFNSKIGSSIDGAMANDFLIAMERTRFDARGHSGRRPTVHVKHAKLGFSKRPAQAHISVKQGLRIWDAVERRELSPAESAAATITCQMVIDLDLRSRFVAKVALAAGYAVYGNLFKDHVRHCEFRGVMNFQEGDSLDRYRDFTIHADDPLRSPTPEPGSQLAMVRSLCRAIGGSIVMLIPSAASLTVAVGILGKYVGMLDVAADTTAFPNSGPYSWGHVVALTGGRTTRCSFADLLKRVASAIQKIG